MPPRGCGHNGRSRRSRYEVINARAGIVRVGAVAPGFVTEPRAGQPEPVARKPVYRSSRISGQPRLWRSIMAELVAVAFDNPEEADRVLSKLNQLQLEYLIDLADAVVAVRQA